MIKCWKAYLIASFVLALLFLWQWDRVQQYRLGYQTATDKLTQQINQAQNAHTLNILRKERETQQRLNEAQQKIQKEREHAKTSIHAMHDELNRLHQYIEVHRHTRNVSATASTTSSSDDEKVTRGWTLFGACTDEYAAMAEIADEQGNDLAEWREWGQVIK